jgi:hypothetical protein
MAIPQKYCAREYRFSSHGPQQRHLASPTAWLSTSTTCAGDFGDCVFIPELILVRKIQKWPFSCVPAAYQNENLASPLRKRLPCEAGFFGLAKVCFY